MMSVENKTPNTANSIEQVRDYQLRRDQFLCFMADMIVKYADEMQLAFEAEEEMLKKKGSSMSVEWEKLKSEYIESLENSESKRGKPSE